MPHAVCPKGWCVEASPRAETDGAHWLGLGWWTAADGLHATLPSLASGPWGVASSELGAPVSHFGQASPIALFWSFRRELGILFLQEPSSFLFLRW